MNPSPNNHSKKFRVATIACALTLTFLAGGLVSRHVHAGTNTMHGGHDHKHEHILTVVRKPAQMSAVLGNLLPHVDSIVSLSAAQKAQLEPVLQQSVTDVAALQQPYEQAQRQMLALLLQDPVDRGAIEALRLEQLQLGERASQQLTQMLVLTASSLTPAQRSQFKAKVEASMAAHPPG